MPDVKRLLKLLFEKYPQPRIALNYSNPLELLVAVILSAQCTDARVNEVTPALFKKYRSARDYADADPAELADDIRGVSFHRNKARMLVQTGSQLVTEYEGEVPQDLDELVKLSGVGRKTANMVLGNAFGVAGIAVDTHVLRVTRRLGLTSAEKPEQVEQDLMRVIPQREWTRFTNAIILHGRETCTARAPHCYRCVVYEVCEWPDKEKRRAAGARIKPES